CSKELLIHGITVGFFFLGENPMKSADKGCRQRGGDKDLRQRVARGLRRGSPVTLHASRFTLLPNPLSNAERSTILFPCRGTTYLRLRPRPRRLPPQPKRLEISDQPRWQRGCGPAPWTSLQGKPTFLVLVSCSGAPSN